jgi:hypothetical protein
MFWIEIRDLTSERVRDYVELVEGEIVICGWESFSLGYYRFWTENEADVFIAWYSDKAVSQGVRLIKCSR